MNLICVNGGRAVKYVGSLSYRRIEKDTIHHILCRKFHKFRLYPYLVSSVRSEYPYRYSVYTRI